jgi:hypothetical protein
VTTATVVFPSLPAIEADAERDTAMKKTWVVGLALLTAACSSGPATLGVATLTAAAPTGASSAPAVAAATPDAMKYAQCMRAHGVPDFPDPVDGGFHITSGPGSDLDPGSAQFAAADTACKAFSPEDRAAGGTVDPQAQAAALKYAACIRSHGVPSYPDPVFVGGSIREAVRAGTGADPNSPQFIAAQQACQSLQPFAAQASTGTGGAANGAGSTGSSGP